MKTVNQPLAWNPIPACPWRIDTAAVKRSELRNALQLRTQTPDDFIRVSAEVDRMPQANANLWEIRQPPVSDKGPDNEVAIETSRDWRLVVTPAYRAFALPVRYAYDGC